MNKFKDRMKQALLGQDSNQNQQSPHPPSHQPHGGQNQPNYNNSYDVKFEHMRNQSIPACNNPNPAQPVKIKSVTHLGNQHSLSTSMVRDLGFPGTLGAYTLLSYGDTLYTKPDLTAPHFMGMTSNSVALATSNPCAVLDVNLLPSGFPDQFVQIHREWGEDMATHSVGITNVIETDPHNATGIVYTLLNHRPGGVNNIRGAGIATVSLDFCRNDGIPVPRAWRVSPTIWDGDTEPWWGDVGAVKAGGYVYAYGHKKDNPWVYLCRVKVEEVLNVECYEYWHGKEKGWSRDRMRGDMCGEEASVFWQINQGQVIWSEYLGRFLFVYCDNFWSSTLLMRTAPAPEGPWSDLVLEHKCKPIQEGGNVYSPAPHGYFDPSGKSLVITFTNHPNCVQAVRVEFE